MTIANYNIASRNSEELIGVVFDSEVPFAKHMEKLCWKANQKLHVLVRVANFMTLEKCRLVMKTFFPNLNIVLLYGCVKAENLITNLIDYKKKLYTLKTMINAQFYY